MQCTHLSVALLDGAEGPFPSHVSLHEVLSETAIYQLNPHIHHALEPLNDCFICSS